MDAMGISYQLYFPTGLALFGGALFEAANNPAFMPAIKGDRRRIARRWFELYNIWLRQVNSTSDRIRATALLFGDTTEELIRQADEHIKAGFKAVLYLPTKALPGGKSPAHPDLDPLWARLAEANVAFTMHIENDGVPLKDDGWRDAPAFKGFLVHGEFNTDPGYLAFLHLPYERFITIMVLGGVFERHPKLRVGIIEVGAFWVGPLMRRLDLWYGMAGKFGKQGEENRVYKLPHPPSYYFNQNVRVTPYIFEDVAHDIAQYDLQKVLCFSTDYPHVEGGKNAFSTFYNKIKGLGESVVEDFFVNNGALLFSK
jgi:predicted TIM-barrel fold metal-dependent hydrolase